MFLNPAIRPNQLQLKDLQATAPAMRLTLLPFEIREADDVDRAFAAIVKHRVDGLVLLPGGPISSNQKRIAELAIEARIPAIYTARVWAEFGGLIASGPISMPTFVERRPSWTGSSRAPSQRTCPSSNRPRSSWSST